MHHNYYLTGTHMNTIYRNLLSNYILEPVEEEVVNRNGHELYEVINMTWQLNAIHNCFATCRDLNWDYLNGELDFYLSGSPRLEDISKHSKFWNNVSDDGWSVNSNYGKLLLHDRNLHNYTQFEYALSCLLNNPNSKKAVMTVYNRENAFKSNDNPCTMYLQFFIRGGRLNLFVKMRSNDIWFGLPYDTPFFILVHQLMKEKLKAKYPLLQDGVYNHQAGSLHAYERNIVKLEEVVNKSLDTKDQEDMFQETITRRVEEWMK